MRLYEFAQPADPRLLAILMQLSQRSEETSDRTPIKVRALINMVKAAGNQAFSLDTLINAYNSTPALQELIKKPPTDLSGDIEFRHGQLQAADIPTKFDPTQTVSNMAKSALHKRT